MRAVTKVITDPEIRSIDEKKRTIWHPISTEKKDRMGDIVRIDGIDVVNFKKKPSVLYGHNYTGYDPLPVIGENVGFMKVGTRLLAGTKFLGPDDGLSGKLRDLADDLWVLNKRKLMGWSVGFIPIEVEDLKENGRTIGKDFKKVELLEYSSVVIPANAGAVNDMISRGVISKGFSNPHRFAEQLKRNKESGLKELVEEIKKLGEDIKISVDSFRLAHSMKAKRFYYREVGEDKVNPDALRLSKRLLEYCKWVLGLPELHIQWIVKCDPGEAGGKPMNQALFGRAEVDGDTILIRADVAASIIRITIPHECHHQWVRQKYGPLEFDEKWEDAAETFAFKLWDEIRRLYLGEDGFISWPR